MAVVLIVEDNPDIAGLYEMVFNDHVTSITEDVPQAIAYLKLYKPDLVITDFYLPSGSGLDVLKYLQAQPTLHRVPVLGVSVDDMLRSEAEQAGMHAFLTKPLDIHELVQTAQKLISGNTVKQQMTLSAEMKVVLNEYAAAFQKIYHRLPDGQWTGTQVWIGGQPRDEPWLRLETRRLNSLMINNTSPKNYLSRLMDKIRRL